MTVDSKKLNAGLAKAKKKRTLKDDYEKYLKKGLSPTSKVMKEAKRLQPTGRLLKDVIKKAADNLKNKKTRGGRKD